MAGQPKAPADPRRESSPGYAPDEPDETTTGPKAPGEGRPDETQNQPDHKPGHGNG